MKRIIKKLSMVLIASTALATSITFAASAAPDNTTQPAQRICVQNLLIKQNKSLSDFSYAEALNWFQSIAQVCHLNEVTWPNPCIFCDSGNSCTPSKMCPSFCCTDQSSVPKE